MLHTKNIDKVYFKMNTISHFNVQIKNINLVNWKSFFGGKQTKNSKWLEKMQVFKIYSYLRGVSEKSISFRILITWPNLVQMIWNFNICKKKFFYFFSDVQMPFSGKEKAFKH